LPKLQITAGAAFRKRPIYIGLSAIL
jgi:hypothetical protein